MFCHKQTDFDNFTLQQGKYFASQIREIIFEKAISEFFHLPLLFLDDPAYGDLQNVLPYPQTHACRIRGNGPF